ncbi:MAG: NADH-quinone oxidoreductase subunit G [Candidatus Erwinia impunctatus]|nr:NADH-quinone oxidoreductase subunit G [Culicoides impunctatus]
MFIMATIHVDGKEYDVNGADNLLQACLSLGLDIPYFCWHPALGSVGACRQCAVKQYQNAEDTRGRLVMSCMTPAADGTFISIDDSEACEFRESVVEWLMTNHPHDCPVCEEGGNCHLQDMTVMTGHSFRRYRFTKRTHRNQQLGPFIAHEMNRCIACYRCVRYYKDYADGTDLGVYGAHDNVYFGRVEDGVLESEFSGNLVEVCPTGVFTDKTHSERYNRKWDMQYAPGICQQCSVGCNTSPGERYGELRRIENRYHGLLNRYFLCDRGRFGYGYVNLPDRPRLPESANGGQPLTMDTDTMLQQVATELRLAKTVIGIGSPRASLESNFVLRDLVGAENFSTGIPEDEQRSLMLIHQLLNQSGLYTPTLREIEEYDAIVILGEDVTQTAARIALSVRQAVKGKAREMAAAQKVSDWQIAAIQNIGQRAKYPLFVTSIDKTRLDDVAAWCGYAPAEEQARIGFAIAHALDEHAPVVPDLSPDWRNQVEIIAQALAGAQKPLIISGVHASCESVIQAAANIAQALEGKGIEVGLTLVSGMANSLGIAMMGGMPLEQALSEAQQPECALVVMENDLYRHLPAAQIDTALASCNTLVVLDHQRTATTRRADFLFPAASFAETDGTLVNFEGRAQRFFQVYDPAYYDQSVVQKGSWRWLSALKSQMANLPLSWGQLDEVIAACVAALPQFSAIRQAAPDADFRVHGQKLSRSPARYSGRTAMRANISVHEPRQPQDADTMFAFSMEGNNQPEAPRSQIPFAWSPGWNSPQAWNKFQDEVAGHLRHGDPGVRLLTGTDEHSGWFSSVPPPFSPPELGWLITPYYYLFGSEELSQRSPVIQSRMSEPCMVISETDARTQQLQDGTVVIITCQEMVWRLPVRLSAQLHPGLIGLPLGLPEFPCALAGRLIEQLQEVV